jgi:signal transduction histidine kinase
MKIRASLHFRVTLAFALLGVTVSTLLGGTLYLAMKDLEQRLIDQALAAEMEDYISRRERNPHSPPPATALVRGYVEPSERFATDVPPDLRTRPPGQYALELEERPYRAAVAEQGGRRFYLLYDISQTVERDRAVLALIISGVLFATLASVGAGYLLARQVIRPVSLLAGRVSGAGADSPATDLASQFPPDEVGQLAQALDHYRARILGFVERERAFTADLSHELRTPLTVIRGATDLLLSDKQLSEPMHSRVERIRRAAEEMSEVTPALLALARETPGTGGATDAVPEVRRLLESHAYLLNGKPVDLSVQLPERFMVDADTALVRVVLGNLIRNAYSYTDEGHIGISLEGADFIISDTGRGIDQELFRNLFEPHMPGASGSGIGLSLVKRICLRYRWQLAVESTGGSGTLIRLRFAASPVLHQSFTSS